MGPRKGSGGISGNKQVHKELLGVGGSRIASISRSASRSRTPKPGMRIVSHGSKGGGMMIMAPPKARMPHEHCRRASSRASRASRRRRRRRSRRRGKSRKKKGRRRKRRRGRKGRKKGRKGKKKRKGRRRRRRRGRKGRKR